MTNQPLAAPGQTVEQLIAEIGELYHVDACACGHQCFCGLKDRLDSVLSALSTARHEQEALRQALSELVSRWTFDEGIAPDHVPDRIPEEHTDSYIAGFDAAELKCADSLEAALSPAQGTDQR